MSKRETIELLEKLKTENLPKATAENTGLKVPQQLSEKEVNDYLEIYAAPQNHCLGGEHSLEFTYGIVHGEGFCIECGFPATQLHYVKDKEGEKHQFVKILQPHPDYLSVE